MNLVLIREHSVKKNAKFQNEGEKAIFSDKKFTHNFVIQMKWSDGSRTQLLKMYLVFFYHKVTNSKKKVKI